MANHPDDPHLSEVQADTDIGNLLARRTERDLKEGWGLADLVRLSDEILHHAGLEPYLIIPGAFRTSRPLATIRRASRSAPLQPWWPSAEWLMNQATFMAEIDRVGIDHAEVLATLQDLEKNGKLTQASLDSWWRALKDILSQHDNVMRATNGRIPIEGKLITHVMSVEIGQQRFPLIDLQLMHILGHSATALATYCLRLLSIPVRRDFSHTYATFLSCLLILGVLERYGMISPEDAARLHYRREVMAATPSRPAHEFPIADFSQKVSEVVGEDLGPTPKVRDMFRKSKAIDEIRTKSGPKGAKEEYHLGLFLGPPGDVASAQTNAEMLRDMEELNTNMFGALPFPRAS